MLTLALFQLCRGVFLIRLYEDSLFDMYYLTFSLDTKQHINIYTNSRDEFTDHILHTKKMEHEKCRQDRTKLILSTSDFL